MGWWYRFALVHLSVALFVLQVTPKVKVTEQYNCQHFNLHTFAHILMPKNVWSISNIGSKVIYMVQRSLGGGASIYIGHISILHNMCYQCKNYLDNDNVMTEVMILYFIWKVQFTPVLDNERVGAV